MKSVLVDATDGGRPFSIARNGNRLVLSRRSKAGRQNHITFTAADALAATNALVDAAEQLEEDN